MNSKNIDYTKMKNDKTIKQHFIPQCYLRNFSPNDSNLFTYDKIEGKSFCNRIKNVAYKKCFYDLPEKFISNLDSIPSGNQFYEKEFFASNVEGQYDVILKKIIERRKSLLKNGHINEIITQQEKEIFAQLIAIQFLRMPDIRDKYSDALKKGVESRLDIMKSVLSNSNPEHEKEIENIEVKYDQDYDPVLHSEMYANEKLYQDISNEILNKHWIYFIAENNDFYTSDNPIVIKEHITNQPSSYEGFGMKGVEIVFPISSSILLTMWDNNHFEKIQQTPDSFSEISGKQIREYNSFQYIYSNRQTYSYNNNFSLIERLIHCNNGNEVFIPKSRILVNGK